MKTVSEKTVEKAINDLNWKKSAGKDGLGQDKLIMAKNILERIINASIEAGEFLKIWKGKRQKRKITGQSAVYQF